MPVKPILIIDDNPDDVEAVKRLAWRQRVINSIVSVPTAEEGIAYLKGEGKYSGREIPVLVLLDLMMPGAGGLSVLDWMGEQPERLAPIIVLTGFRHLPQVTLAYQMGAHSFLMKPFEEREFGELVKSFKGIEVRSD